MIYTINGASYDSDYLAHYNIPGSKWGQRRWQYKDGSLTPEGKIRYRKSSTETEGARHSGPKTSAKAKKEAVQKVKEAEANERLEKEKQRILKEGTASEVYKIRNQLSKSEKEEVLNRLQSDDRIRDYASKEPKQKTTFEKVGNFMKKMATVSGWVSTSSQMYNNVAKVINAFSNEDATKLPLIASGESDKPKSNKKKSAK